MDDITGKIELYHNLFLGCLLLCILCFIIAVVIFFVLDIKSVFGYLTGRSARKQIQKLEEANALSGRLLPRERTNMQYVAEEMKEDMGVRGAIAPGARKVEHVVQSVSSDLSNTAKAGGRFMPPEPNANQKNQETSVLQEQSGSQETVPEDESTAILQEAERKTGTFRMEREIILIHAEEVI